MNITVGITSYNQHDFLVEAIESVLAQTVPAAEVLIVDDASTDGSPQRIAAYAARHPERIRPILLSANGGVNAARNHILDAATGDYLSFLDGDDCWRAHKLEREVARLVQSDRPDAVFGDFTFIRAGAPSFRWAANRRPPEGNLTRQVLTLDLPRSTLFRSELVPTRLWREAGYYDPSFALYGDWDMRIRQAQSVGRYAYVDEPLSDYRRHDAGISMGAVGLHLAAIDHIERKYATLIETLDASNGRVRVGLARFRAKVIRDAGLRLTRERPPGFRAEALRHYLRSLRYYPAFDARLLWRMVKP